jgi:redox-sensitive bicupin YhaK (pirin superfamily)
MSIKLILSSKTEHCMITIRPSAERGGGNHGWLNTKHTFSFADYWDPKWMGFRSLRVINEDRVRPNAGFPTHPHRDMEIITYVLSGKLEHKDSLGTGSVILPGDGQRMTAGSGIRHSEFNPSTTEPVHFLQIWMLPEKAALPPSYEQKSFPEDQKRGKLRVIASRDAREGSVKIHQDAKLYVSLLKPDEEVTHQLAKERYGWLQVARGAVQLNGKKLNQGDGAAISDETMLALKATEDAEVLLFDLA